jgi:hypothetical protein
VPDQLPDGEDSVTGLNAEAGLRGLNAEAGLPGLLRARRERLGYIGDDGIDEVAGIAAVTPERWRQLERDGALPAPDELPRIALALVDLEVSGPADDPGEVLAELRASIGPEP